MENRGELGKMDSKDFGTRLQDGDLRMTKIWRV